jgi:quercetin dioxygenase-like cupin family protein
MTSAQVPGLTRTDLQRHDLSLPGREVIQNRVDISPDAPPVRHKHPGEEIIYVLEGTLEYSIDGREPGPSVPARSCSSRPKRSTR